MTSPRDAKPATDPTGRSERLLVASRNEHKLREIRRLLADVPVSLVSLTDLGLPPQPGEEDLEAFDTFEANAVAKARFYRSLSGLPTIADDSGICVEALSGRPGVRSRRFAPEGWAGETDQDVANNAYLLNLLRDVPTGGRSAHYRCALAMVSDRLSLVVHGRVDGRIAREPRGSGGFGYDPLFVLSGTGSTYGELAAEVKEATSHRALAIDALRRWLTPAAQRQTMQTGGGA